MQIDSTPPRRGPAPGRGRSWVLTQAEKALVVEQYLAGAACPELGRRYGVTQDAIEHLLNRRGIARRPPQIANRRYRLDQGYFASITSEGRAYWLGFLGADGCVRRGADVRVLLGIEDEGHLLRLRDALGSDAPIDSGTNYPRRRGIRFWSPAMAEDLSRHGVVERKSMLLPWPTTVPDGLLRHYLRGYHDGDGWMSVRRWQSDSLEWGLVANLGFLQNCAGYLERTVGLRPPKIRQRFPPKPYGLMSYHGRRQVSRLWHFLYDGATIWLPRKRDKIEPYVFPPEPEAHPFRT